MYKTDIPKAFTSNQDHWRLFCKIRFDAAGHGEFVVVKKLNLAGLELHDFIVEHLVFDSCILDDVSFRRTQFSFDTTFINCSIKKVDFTATFASSALFYNCDLTGSIFPKIHRWSTVGLDKKDIPSFFIGCTMEPELKAYLEDDGNIVADSLDQTDEQSRNLLRWRLEEIKQAPVLKF